jgi:predicted dinucleotide-binding enzyme
LALDFASKGIKVLLANNHRPASLEDIVRKLGSKVKAVAVKQIAWADTVILAGAPQHPASLHVTRVAGQVNK